MRKAARDHAATLNFSDAAAFSGGAARWGGKKSVKRLVVSRRWCQLGRKKQSDNNNESE